MKTSILVITAVTILAATSHAEETAAPSKAGAGRVDFDDQLVQGQVNRGAVHLIERRDADLGSLVKLRDGYRTEILGDSNGKRRLPAKSKTLVLPEKKKR